MTSTSCPESNKASSNNNLRTKPNESQDVTTATNVTSNETNKLNKKSSNESVSSSSSSTANFPDVKHVNRRTSRSQQRRFHVRFPTVEADEMLIDWYSCALVADILLQGYLYISDNYFAFYSNIFGYKTNLLIPMSDVVSVSKERTAKIFPNAVGITTEDAKYVFGSLLSRESTYRLIKDVWRSNLLEIIPKSVTVNGLDNYEEDFDEEKLDSAGVNAITRIKDKSSTLTKDSPKRPMTPVIILAEDPSILLKATFSPDHTLKCQLAGDGQSSCDSEPNGDESPQLMHQINCSPNSIKLTNFNRIRDTKFLYRRFKTYFSSSNGGMTQKVKGMPRTTQLLMAGTLLLLLMLTLACLLLFRVTLISNKMKAIDSFLPELRDYNQLQQFQSQLTKDLNEISQKLREKLDELGRVGSSLQQIITEMQHLPDHCSGSQLNRVDTNLVDRTEFNK